MGKRGCQDAIASARKSSIENRARVGRRRFFDFSSNHPPVAHPEKHKLRDSRRGIRQITEHGLASIRNIARASALGIVITGRRMRRTPAFPRESVMESPAFKWCLK